MHGACSPIPATVRTIRIEPPEVLLRDCPLSVPPKQGTNGDLLKYAMSLQIDLIACNRQIARLRDWIAGENGNSI